jgi:3-oxoacyl-ACP reductase-like protein
MHKVRRCLKDGALHAGWVDVKTGDLVDDKDVRGK